ncbi:hypothetical protein AAG906_029003 [Vitis piasezkii]
MGQGYEDQLVTQEGYTNDIQRLYKVASSIVNVRQQDMDLSTYIGQIASLKEEFLTVISSWFLHLLAFVQILRPSAIRFLAVSPFHPWMMCLLASFVSPPLKLCHLITLQIFLLVTEVEANVLIAPIAISLATLVIGVISYMGDLPAIKSAYFAKTNNACLNHTSFLGPWCSFNLIFISKITRIPNCSITFSDKFVTLQDRSTGKTIGIGRESQGLYHLTSPLTPAVCISTDASLLIHSRLGHPSLSKFQKMVPHFSYFSSLACESCQLSKHTRVSFPKRLNNRAKTHHSSPSLSLFLFLKSYPFLLSPHLMQCLLTHFRFIIAVIVSLFIIIWPRYLLTHFLSLRLLLSQLCLILLTYPLLIRKSTHEALSHPGWRQAMFSPDGQVDRLKAHLVAKGYTQVYGSDYGDTFSHVAKIAYVRLLLSMVAMRSWPIYQLDIKNVFLHGDLAEEVYMEQPPGFVARGLGLVCFGMFHSTTDHFVFYHHNSSGRCIYLQHIFTHFQTKDLGKLKYFLGIEIAQSNSGVVLSQMKYALDILEETNAVIRILRYIKSTPGQGVLYENRGHTQVVGYTDADWVGSPIDRRSTSGYCVFIRGNPIS